MLINIKKVGIIQNTFSDHNAGRPDINRRRKSGKFQVWKFKSTCLTSQWIQEESTKEIRKSLEINENKNTMYQSSWDSVRQGHTGEEAT